MAVRSQVDVETAQREARRLARSVGFDAEATECVALATAELATNLVRYAHAGEILLHVLDDTARGEAIEIESRDAGPGIADIEQALQEGFSTGGGLGAGLASVRRLMDEFSVASEASGTRILARKWSSKTR